MSTSRIIKSLNFIFFILIWISGCGNKSPEVKVSTKKVKNLFVKEVGVESIDSIYLEAFLQRNPDYKPFRKKIFKFYGRRNYNLAWSNEGEFLPQTSMFINKLQNLINEGAEPANYNATSLRSMYYDILNRRKRNPETSTLRKNIDVLLSASYFKYARDMWKGKVDPNDEKLAWNIEKKKIKYGKTLDAILEDKSDENPFTKFEPTHEEYKKLKLALAKYNELDKNGGWQPLNLDKGKLALNDTSKDVSNLCKHLIITGDLSPGNKDSIFTSSIEAGVKKFQKRHGLKEDGIVAGETLKEINVPVKKRIKQILVNMERWRWVPEKFSDNYIIVNIPEYKLHVYEYNKKAWEMNVIVGSAATSTPIFNDIMEYVVFSPYWNVPKSIADNELLPLLRSNPVVLEKENMEMYAGNDPNASISPYSIDWSKVTPSNNKYKFRQRPGRGNSLGLVKFLFPNEYDVYLHDTPTDHLFSQHERGFSHGCIRLEEPQKLAEYLLKDDSDWPKDKIKKHMMAGQEKYVKLKEKMPVYIVYFTTWMDENGQIHFRDDIYGHDNKLAKAYFE